MTWRILKWDLSNFTGMAEQKNNKRNNINHSIETRWFWLLSFLRLSVFRTTYRNNAIFIEELNIEGYKDYISIAEDIHSNLWVATETMGLVDTCSKTGSLTF
jgi:hypothetical protein